MIVASRLSKTNKLTMGSKIAKTSPSALADAARRRRKLVLKPIKQDTFLSGVSIRKAMGHRRERVRRLSPVPKCNAKDKSQPRMLLPTSYNVSCDDSTDQPAQITHVGGGVSANCIIASRMPEILQRPELHDVLPQIANRSAHASQLALKGLEIVRRELIKNGDR
ncbi:uncharacterized protein FOMMEDRAFT_20572 [Fomitiporia mediterranea MF3/22]|uniref:uncharacterized protein n=1 Tax=Fomitiporia mediterranea (strain MF3/22) TaxID=694068 RepID=UPI0004408D2A|nr:uncharacterized protein FOMMEDRAFT_20572 [Fomitiporia mediterranea MF3/22]EJD01802.1 hypothetical protein FOMMEDRAFT_20572 [Fomitiporia mediterranea MF3/22]